MAGGRLGTEIAGTSPATNNSPPQTAQWGALALPWLGGLGQHGRKSVTLSLQPLCVQNSHLSPGAHLLCEHAHSMHTHVCGSESDGGSRWQLGVQEVEREGGREEHWHKYPWIHATRKAHPWPPAIHTSRLTWVNRPFLTLISCQLSDVKLDPLVNQGPLLDN